MQFQEIPAVSDAAGDLSWSKPLPGGAFHPPAFDATVALTASRYTPPAPGRRALPLENVAGNAEWQAEAGGLTAAIRKLVTIDLANVAQPILPEPEKLKLRINPASGLIAGSFVHAGLGRAVTFGGAVLQKSASAIGNFAAADRTGTVTVERNAQFSGSESGTGSRPRVTIELPVKGTRVPEPAPSGGSGFTPAVILTGRAIGSQPIASLRYQFAQNGAVSGVEQVAGSADWEIPLFLGAGNAGPLTVFVKAIDANGNESALVSRSIHYVVVRDITVAVNDRAMGAVTDGFLGATPRELGQRYTITAVPSAGHRFTGWSGSVPSTANPLVFQPTQFFFLQANFELLP